ncbi:uncharacterized protein phf11 isoform X3 [Misgurnus anguillicaudatus]|uniref:uncharacterized protein phf11 isoform X3 n=1 Tax=Misgurnus anguillicaudatus TaxID=75329 RepID=UPI003CCF4D84
MGSDQHRTPSNISCVLCGTSDETEITGALSSKDHISAHQNCLLFASGIYCKNSPTYDDLFGFTVDDIKKEVRRGNKLTCYHCSRRGATAGCEVKRCKRSYHYPCAREDKANVIEDSTKGRYILYCEKHNQVPNRTESVNGASTSGLNRPKKRGLSENHGQRPGRRESNSSTGSSELGSSRSLKKKSPENFLDSDDEIQTPCDPTFAPVESDIDECTPPKQTNSAPVAEDLRRCGEPNPLSTALVYGPSTSAMNNGGGSEDGPGQLNDRMELDSPVSSPDAPRRKLKKMSILYSDDELDDETSTDPVVSPVVAQAGGCTSPSQHKHSTPVTKNTRPSEELNPLTTGDDDDDTDIETDSFSVCKDVSQSLLPPNPYSVTVPCTVIMDSGPSLESESSLELGSPSRAIPADTHTSPGSEPRETTTTNIKAPTDDTPSSAKPTPQQKHLKKALSDHPGSCSDHLSPTASVVQPLSPSLITPDHPAEISLDRPAVADACCLTVTSSSVSSAAQFWARCNEAKCTESIFSELVCQLNSLREQIQSQKASHQDFDVALKILEASGRLPTIITQLEKDLKEQEEELQKKKAALRDARAVLGI